MATQQGNGNRNQGQQQGSNQESTQMTRQQAQQGGAMSRPSRRRAMSPFARSSLTSSSPFSMMRRVFDDMERMMDSMMPDFDELPSMAVSRVLEFIPDIDVHRRDSKLVVRADLPGISPDQVQVYVNDNGNLVIEGERRSVDERTEGDIWQSERVYGHFYREIPLPEGTSMESAQARFENGVLEVTLDAPQHRGRGKKIEIQSTGPQQGQGQPRQQGNTPAKASEQPTPGGR